MAEPAEVSSSANGDGKPEENDTLQLKDVEVTVGGASAVSVKDDEPLESLRLETEPAAAAEGDPCDLFKGEDIICKKCVLNEVALAYCKDCKEYLCEDCYRFHKNMVACKDHSIIENPKIDELRNLYYCSTHPGKDLNFFCETCCGPICQDCFVTTCNEHKKLLDLHVRQEMEGLLGGVRANVSAFCEFAEYIKKVMEDSEEAAQRCSLEVNRIFESAMRQLEDTKSEVLQFLKDKKIENVQKNEEQQAHVHQKIGEMQGAIKDTEALLNSKKASRVMVNRITTCALLEAWAMQTWYKRFAVYQSWKLDHKPVEVHTKNFGKLIPKPRPEDIIIGGLINQDAKVGVTNTFTVTVYNILDQLKEFDDFTATNFVSVKIVFTDNKCPDTPTMITSRKHREGDKWTIQYFIRREGEIMISVNVCGEQVEPQTFTVHTSRVELKENDRVERGPDWNWDNQDGGETKKGTVIRCSQNGWATVRWDKTPKKTNDYRWGAEDCFDLKVVGHTRTVNQ